jgi:hypothetical protein
MGLSVRTFCGTFIHISTFIKVFASLRLTVVILVLAMVLVFAGTLAEVHLGLYRAQSEFFHSFFVYWHPENTGWKIPVFPGGYSMGVLLLLNLITAHATRFKLSREKIGLWLIHSGLILLILGQLFTDMFAVESRIHLRVGETKNYSEFARAYELQPRPERFYLPFSLHLLEFRHDVYNGTDIPKNYSSRLLLDRPDTGEHREVLIHMNNPLRCAGWTFYQAGFDADDQGTILQVVKNPGWLTPYLACGLIAMGLIVQFLSHLIPFLRRRRTA